MIICVYDMGFVWNWRLQLLAGAYDLGGRKIDPESLCLSSTEPTMGI